MSEDFSCTLLFGMGYTSPFKEGAPLVVLMGFEYDVKMASNVLDAHGFNTVHAPGAASAASFMEKGAHAILVVAQWGSCYQDHLTDGVGYCREWCDRIFILNRSVPTKEDFTWALEKLCELEPPCSQ